MTPRCKRCRKKRHATLTEAIRAALSNSARFGRALRAYACLAGQGWHLTTQRSRGA